jgi:hypothetical protein
MEFDIADANDAGVDQEEAQALRALEEEYEERRRSVKAQFAERRRSSGLPATPRPELLQSPARLSPATPPPAATSSEQRTQEGQRPRLRRPKPNLSLMVPQPESPPIRSITSPSMVSPAARRTKQMEGAWSDGAVTPTSARTPATPASRATTPRPTSGGGGSGGSRASSLLSPQPVAIDMPSPSFDPMLEHFIRPFEAGTMCACVLERAARGKAFRVLLEEGNVLLLVAERRYRDFEIASADGTRVATLHRAARGQFVLRRANPCVAAALSPFAPPCPPTPPSLSLTSPTTPVEPCDPCERSLEHPQACRAHKSKKCCSLPSGVHARAQFGQRRPGDACGGLGRP